MAVIERTNPLARRWATSSLVTQWVIAAGVAALLVETVNYLFPNRDSLLDIAYLAVSFLVPTVAQALVLGQHFRELRPKQWILATLSGALLATLVAAPGIILLFILPEMRSLLAQPPYTQLFVIALVMLFVTFTAIRQWRLLSRYALNDVTNIRRNWLLANVGATVLQLVVYELWRYVEGAGNQVTVIDILVWTLSFALTAFITGGVLGHLLAEGEGVGGKVQGAVYSSSSGKGSSIQSHSANRKKGKHTASRRRR